MGQSSVTFPTRLRNERRAVLATLVRNAHARHTHSTAKARRAAPSMFHRLAAEMIGTFLLVFGAGPI
jgi:glycerol uptake facilitator-like aquaporin